MNATEATAAHASPFHEGEQRVQTALGVRDEIEPWAKRVVRPFLPEEHADFYAALPFLVAAARDASGRPWATLLAGAPGFVQSPDPRTLEIGARPAAGDALADALQAGADIGLLGIELETRRRNRVNGRIRGDGGSLALAVDQTFGNCPQHIHPRAWCAATPSPQPSAPIRSFALSSAQRRFVEGADTFFIASGHRGSGDEAVFGMDASHRGGPRGFVRVEGRRLVFPDYAGNNHFNTLGNLVLDERAGLLFVDFARGGLLQLTGRAEIDWQEPDPQRWPGARRLVYFEIDEVVEQKSVLPLRFTEPEASTRDLHVVKRRVESADVVSFWLEDPSGAALPSWQPGQHLPLEVVKSPGTPAALRTYSLSNAPGGAYRISVKREEQGQVSRALHDRIAVGSTLRATAPAGDFVLDLPSAPPERPVVLIGAGIGITPLASMVHAVAQERPEQELLLVHGVRDGLHHPLVDELQTQIARLPNARMHVRYSRPLPEDVRGRDYHDAGRVDIGLLARLLPGLDGEFFLCGPATFMAALEGDLLRLGVDPQRIHFESF
jgi:ferredoxin-NADP reductase/predicted pyridoxine 5'-phosphate oxidase superfamily flavin-nucleotide-binding protein